MTTQPALTNDEIIQAYTDILGALVLAIGRQLDPARLRADLQLLANAYAQTGSGPTAGLLDELIRHVDTHLLGRQGEH
ncbi:MAG TPA: hypothetical protein DEP36_00975 [Gammaproteobacteria bacterium]|nr:hypothetical protein [Gammaproteobacteria bacterium]